MKRVAASEWFTREKVGDGIWHVWEPHTHPFLRCNIWIVNGRDHALLVDTGLGMVSLAPAIADLLERPCIAVATHYHFDHVGSLHEFDVRLAHAAGVAYLSDTANIGGALRRSGFSEAAWQSFLDAGYELPDELLFARPAGDDAIDTYAVTPCPPTRVLEEGDVVDIGDRAFTVLHLPGHSPDSIGLYEEASGTLFSGDAVYDGPLLDGEGDSDRAAYVATMERLRQLPVQVVHAGHEASFGRQRLVALCDAYLDRAAH